MSSLQNVKICKMFQYVSGDGYIWIKRYIMRPGTFSQIYIQVVFAVRGRRSLIMPQWEDELFMYITGIIQRRGQKLIAINGVPDHIHLLIGLKPQCRLSDLIREVKKNSNLIINKKNLVENGNFQWQKGFGAFSYGKSQVDRVVRYIENQKEHHKTHSFKEEYTGLLDKFEVDFDQRFLFEWIDY